MQNLITNLTQLQLNASLSFDDVINVFVSKYEDELYAMRTNIQALMRTVESNIDKLKAQLVNAYTEELLGAYQAAHPNIAFSFPNPTLHYDESAKTASIVGNVSYTIPRPNQMNIIVSYGYNHTLDLIKHSEQAFVTVRPADLEQLNTLCAEKVELISQFQVINAALQGLERKVRQIKAYVAAERLKAEGYQALLDDDNIKTMLSLPKFD